MSYKYTISEAQDIADKIDIIDKCLQKEKLTIKERDKLTHEKETLMFQYQTIVKKTMPKAAVTFFNNKGQ